MARAPGLWSSRGAPGLPRAATLQSFREEEEGLAVRPHLQAPLGCRPVLLNAELSKGRRKMKSESRSWKRRGEKPQTIIAPFLLQLRLLAGG